MHVTSIAHDDQLFVTIEGKINSSSSGLLFDTLVEQVRAGWQHITLDLTGLQGLTRAGCRGIIVAGKLLQQTGGNLRVVGANATCETFLKSLGYRHLLHIRPVGTPMEEAHPAEDEQVVAMSDPMAVSLVEFLTRTAWKQGVAPASRRCGKPKAEHVMALAMTG
ncbi:MAG: STAS domain-containing protein [Rhodobacteraceae bacterium]|nr:STAS domain-containing protein [Paracoccaceae bacterium]